MVELAPLCGECECNSRKDRTPVLVLERERVWFLIVYILFFFSLFNFKEFPIKRTQEKDARKIVQSVPNLVTQGLVNHLQTRPVLDARAFADDLVIQH
jgi:(2Fe-2S) ferredoxin